MSDDNMKCSVCDQPMRGRRDKKFCSNQCRNEYHNQKNSEVNAFVYEINSILKKNRAVLNKMNPNDKARTTREELLVAGFNFNYYTNTYITKAGKVYRFVYEQGYLELDDQKITIVKKKEYVR